jgi:hypothetical protein
VNPHFPSPADPEERLEAWLAAQPLTPAPDFVMRTLARIHAEANLVASAKAGDEAAIEALLDRWLGEQPLDAEFEATQLAIQARRDAAREAREETRRLDVPRRKVIFFPAWVHSLGGVAVAAAVLLVAYFSGTRLGGPSVALPVGAVANNTVSTHVAVDNNPSPAPVTASDDTSVPYDWTYNPDRLVQLNDSLSGDDSGVLLNADAMNILGTAEQDSDGVPN